MQSSTPFTPRRCSSRPFRRASTNTRPRGYENWWKRLTRLRGHPVRVGRQRRRRLCRGVRPVRRTHGHAKLRRLHGQPGGLCSHPSRCLSSVGILVGILELTRRRVQLARRSPTHRPRRLALSGGSRLELLAEPGASSRVRDDEAISPCSCSVHVATVDFQRESYR